MSASKSNINSLAFRSMSVAFVNAMCYSFMFMFLYYEALNPVTSKLASTVVAVADLSDI